MLRNWSIEEGYFICALLDNMPITFLIDTGSNVTILSKEMLQKLPSETKTLVEPTTLKMLTVTGEVNPFLG